MQHQETKNSLSVWYRKNCERKLRDAAAASQAGDVDGLEAAILLARTYAERSGLVLDESDISQTMKNGYRNGLAKKIQKIVATRQSDPLKAQEALKMARVYAQKAELSIEDSEWEALQPIFPMPNEQQEHSGNPRDGTNATAAPSLRKLGDFTIVKNAEHAVLYDRDTLHLKPLSMPMAANLALLLDNRGSLSNAPSLDTKIAAIVDYMTEVKLEVAHEESDENNTLCHEEPSSEPKHNLARHQVLDRLAINIANSCNLACTYCYANKGLYGKSDQFIVKPELIETTLTRFAERFQLINNIQFMGGEPSMNPDAIEHAALVIRKLVDAGKLVAPAGLGMVSNGLNFSEKFWRVLKTYNCGVTFSLDGPKDAHDYARKRKNGSGSYDKIRENIKRARAEGVRVSFEATYSQAHLLHGVSLIDLCQWFYDEFGHRFLHAPPMSANPYPTAGERDLGLTNEEKIREYCAAAEWSLDNLLSGKVLMHGFAERILRNFQTQKKNTVCCPAGISQLSVSTTGDVSPCWMFTDDEPFYMGSVKKDDFLGPRAAAVVETMGEYDFATHPDCAKCWIKPVCFGCRGADYHATGTIDGKTDCDYMRELVKTVVLKICDVHSILQARGGKERPSGNDHHNDEQRSHYVG